MKSMKDPWVQVGARWEQVRNKGRNRWEQGETPNRSACDTQDTDRRTDTGRTHATLAQSACAPSSPPPPPAGSRPTGIDRLGYLRLSAEEGPEAWQAFLTGADLDAVAHQRRYVDVGVGCLKAGCMCCLRLD